MTQTRSDEQDVVIAGGGPVGLMLACELGLRGRSVTVVERLAEPDTTIKAGAVNGRSVDAFDRRGLRPRLAEVHDQMTARMAGLLAERGVNPAAAFRKGHFAGLYKVGFTPQELPAALDVLRAHPRGLLAAGGTGQLTGGQPSMGVPQQEIERILAERAVELGVVLRRGCSVVGVDQDDSGVRVDLATHHPDAPRGTRSLHARYLVGCDGGRSTVRKLVGFEFPGTAPTLTGRQAIVELADAGKLALGWQRTGTGLMVYGPFPGRVLTVEFDGPPADRDTPVTREELQASIRRVSGTDVTVTAVTTATRFTDNARLVEHYRAGRVLLAGDAAHVHSPFGAQGLNLGLQDAVNLGWKLATVLAGDADEALLDTYTAERHPVAERVLANTRAQIALLRPDEQTDALRELFSELMDLEQVNWYLTELMSGLGIRYRVGLPADAHPMTGRHCPDLVLDGPDGTTRLAELCHDGRGLLVDLVDEPDLRTVAAGWSDRVRTVHAKAADAGGLTALLVRPDGYLAWVADDGSAPADPAGLETALRAWFGPPR